MNNAISEKGLSLFVLAITDILNSNSEIIALGTKIDAVEKAFNTKLEKNKYGNFGKSFEFMYLEESCPEEIDFDKDSIYFKGARMLRGYLTLLSKIKIKLKNIRRRKK